MFRINNVPTDSGEAWDAHITAMKELDAMLRQHDWFHDYSDDHSVWRRGVEQRKAIEQKVAMIGLDGKRLLKAYLDIKFGPAHGSPYVYPDEQS